MTNQTDEEYADLRHRRSIGMPPKRERAIRLAYEREVERCQRLGLPKPPLPLVVARAMAAKHRTN